MSKRNSLKMSKRNYQPFFTNRQWRERWSKFSLLFKHRLHTKGDNIQLLHFFCKVSRVFKLLSARDQRSTLTFFGAVNFQIAGIRMISERDKPTQSSPSPNRTTSIQCIRFIQLFTSQSYNPLRKPKSQSFLLLRNCGLLFHGEIEHKGEVFWRGLSHIH